jgi:phage tail-like protein
MPFQNPARAYRFRVEADGVDQWSVQKVTIPDISMSVVEHGAGDHNIKTASKKGVGNATFEKLLASDGTADRWGYLWLETCIVGIPTLYKRNLVVKLLGNDGLTTVRSWLLIGCFPVNLTKNDLDRMADENFMETLELSVDDVKEL